LDGSHHSKEHVNTFWRIADYCLFHSQMILIVIFKQSQLEERHMEGTAQLIIDSLQVSKCLWALKIMYEQAKIKAFSLLWANRLYQKPELV